MLGGIEAGDLRELPWVPLRGEGSCGVGGASQDSAGSGATEEGLTSRGGRNLMGFLELQRQCGVSHEVLRGAELELRRSGSSLGPSQ